MKKKFDLISNHPSLMQSFVKNQQKITEWSVFQIIEMKKENLVSPVKRDTYKVVIWDFELSSFSRLHFGQIDYLIGLSSKKSHAFDALKAGAKDFILLPFKVNELRKALRAVVNSFQILNDADHMIDIPISRNQRSRIAVNDIIRCESCEGFTKIFLAGAARNYILTTIGLGQMGHLLAGQNFFRVHKQHMVNLDYVKNSPLDVEHKYLNVNGSFIPIARRQKKTLKQILYLT